MESSRYLAIQIKNLKGSKIAYCRNLLVAAELGDNHCNILSAGKTIQNLTLQERLPWIGQRVYAELYIKVGNAVLQRDVQPLRLQRRYRPIYRAAEEEPNIIALELLSQVAQGAETEVGVICAKVQLYGVAEIGKGAGSLIPHIKAICIYGGEIIPQHHLLQHCLAISQRELSLKLLQGISALVHSA